MSENNEYTNTSSDAYDSSASGSYYNGASENSVSGNRASDATGNSYQYGDYYQTSQTTSYGSENGGSSSGNGGSSSGNGGSNNGNGKSHGSQRKSNRPKKGKSFWRKAAAIALSAVLFGGVAGSAMVGVQYAAEKAGIVSSVDKESEQTPIKIAESSNQNSSASGDTGLADVSSVVEKVLPSVVAITNSQIYENYASQYGWSYWFGNYNNRKSEDQQEEIEAGSGSGIIIGQNDKELLIVTNYHVIQDADSLTITFIDESTVKASVKGTDSDNDLAVVAVPLSDLKKETKDAIAIATLDRSENCKVGQGVIAIGNALGYGQSITVGYISALNREVETSKGSSRKLLQTDAAINPGNSGGALVNASGDVIGINSAKYSDTDVEGMGFAIPISTVYDIIDNLMNQKTKIEVAENQRGYLGIRCASVDSAYAQTYNMPNGVYVHSILKGGAASKSDLQERDIITKINGIAVSTQEELMAQLKYYAIGEKITLTVSRLDGSDYKSMEIEITLAAQVKE